MTEPVQTVLIQCKAPYTALSLPGFKLIFGEPKRINMDDWRFQWWLDRDMIETPPDPVKKKKGKEKEL